MLVTRIKITMTLKVNEESKRVVMLCVFFSGNSRLRAKELTIVRNFTNKIKK